jgi:hypothetical protein
LTDFNFLGYILAVKIFQSQWWRVYSVHSLESTSKLTKTRQSASFRVDMIKIVARPSLLLVKLLQNSWNASFLLPVRRVEAKIRNL